MSEFISDEDRKKNFENWFKKSKVKSAGKPKMVYHGTLANFESFDLSKTNSESYWGKGFYFSTSIKDINNNYATLNGADYKNRLERIKEKIEQDNEFDNKYLNDDGERVFLSEEAIETLALQQLETQHQGLIIPAYLSIQNPFDEEKTKWEHSFLPVPADTLKEAVDYLDSKKFKNSLKNNDISLNQYEIESMAQYLREFASYEVPTEQTVDWDDFREYLVDNFCIDEDAATFVSEQLENKFKDNVIAEFTQADTIITRLLNHLEDKISSNSFADVNALKTAFQEALEADNEGYEDVAINAGQFIAKLKEKSYNFYEPSEDEPSFMDLITEHLKNEGYDGIIMQADNKGFNMKMDKNTKHYICWEPTQIKSAIGNKGEYSLENANILYRVAQKIDVSHKEMPLQEVKETILEFSSKMDNFIKFRVFDTVDEAISKKILPEDADKSTKGFFYDKNNDGKGFIGIIRTNIESKQDLLTTYVHEAVGHSSVKNMLGEKYKPTMIKLFDYYNRAHKKTFNPENDKFFNSEQKVQKAEEFLAVSIERKFNTGFSGIRLLVGAALNKVRKFFPELPITSFDTDYIENAAFKHYQKSELKDINIAQTVEEEIKGRNLVLNVQRAKTFKSNKTQPT